MIVRIEMAQSLASRTMTIAALAAAIKAIGTEGFDSEIVRLLMNLTQYDQITMMCYSRGGKPILLFNNHDKHETDRILSPYIAGAYLLDPYYNMVLGDVSDGVYLLSEQAPDNFQQSEYFKKYYCKIGIYKESAAFCRLSSDMYLVLSLGMAAEVDDAEANLAAARDIFPCLQAIFLKHYAHLLASETDRSTSLEDMCRQKGLSGREVEVTALLLQGFSNKLIARKLDISPETVKIYRKRINRKLGTSTAREIFVDFFTPMSPTAFRQ